MTSFPAQRLGLEKRGLLRDGFTADLVVFDRFGQAGFVEPALIDKNAPGGPTAVPNPEKAPQAELQLGNLDYSQTNCVHTVEDVPLGASGPGSVHFNGVLDNTEVFFAMANALGLDARTTRTA